MPRYNYHCRRCGPFDDWQPMSRSDAPAKCPRCGRPAPRAVSLPNMNLMDGATRTAHSRNEKSAHAPEVVQRAPAVPTDGGRRRKPKLASGHRDRPWMVGH
jgi:putative FmdB family regulatory protein